MKRKGFQTLRPSVDANAIEEEIFDGHPYGFARLNLPSFFESIDAETENGEQATENSSQTSLQRKIQAARPHVSFRDKGTLTKGENAPQDSQKTTLYQKRVEQRVDSSAQVFINTSEIHREETPGKKERYFP